jgi:hypothetical protein
LQELLPRGDHLILFGQVLEAVITTNEEPLIFYAGQYL